MAHGRIICGLFLWCILFASKISAGAREDEDFIHCLSSSSSSSYDYKDALSKGILFFEGQRSGKLPNTQRVKWRGDSALSDGNPDNV